MELFSKEQLDNMSHESLVELCQIMQDQKEALQEKQQKNENELRILKEKNKELEFMNAMLSDRLTLAQRKRFGASSEKYAEGYTQMSLFNKAEQESGSDAPEPEMEEIHPSM